MGVISPAVVGPGGEAIRMGLPGCDHKLGTRLGPEYVPNCVAVLTGIVGEVRNVPGAHPFWNGDGCICRGTGTGNGLPSMGRPAGTGVLRMGRPPATGLPNIGCGAAMVTTGCGLVGVGGATDIVQVCSA